MKKFVFLIAVSAISFLSFANDPVVSEKVLTAFNKTFQNVKNVNWFENTGSYEVRFVQNEVRIKVNYDKEGNIINTIRYYSEQHLPIMVLSKIKSKYTGKTIHSVTELSSEEGTTYYVTLEDEKTWLDLKADQYGSMTVVKKLKKA